MSNSVLFDVDDSICTITLNRPEVRNAVDGPMAQELREAFESFETDENLRVAVLAGAGDTFCSGADLSAIQDPERRHLLDAAGPGPMGPTRMAISKPVIAAISGFAVAGGLELALLADMRVCEEDATFGVFCRKWGVPLIDGGTVRLPRIVGHGRAMDMILTGRAVSASEALQMGLVNRVVPLGQSLQVAHAIAESIASFPNMCMRSDRESVIRQWDLPLMEALLSEGENASEILRAEGIAGAQEFLSRSRA